MARSSWNLTSLRMKIGCLSYCWESNDCLFAFVCVIVLNGGRKRRDICTLKNHIQSNRFENHNESHQFNEIKYSRQSMGCRRTRPPYVPSRICLRLQVCNQRVCHSPTTYRIRLSTYFDDCSIEDRTVDHPPSCCFAVFLIVSVIR